MKESKSGAISVLFQPLGKRVRVKREANVLELALKHKVDVDNSCGGSGSCGTCRVKILSDLSALSEPTEVEKAMIKDRGFEKNERLACQLEPCKGLIVEVPIVDKSDS